MSPTAKKLLTSDMNRRVPTHRGARYATELVELTRDLAKKLFRVDFAEFRFWGCSVANAVAMRCLTEVGDAVLALQKPRGHKSYREEGYGGHRGLQYCDIPFDFEEFDVDLDGFAEVSYRIRPKLMIVGTSLFLFPHPLREMGRIASEIGARIMYDGAHVLGLIAGGKFQDPIREGAYVLTGSAQKTLAGPVGGFILHNDSNLDAKVRRYLNVYQGSIGNRIPSLAITLAEMLVFGRETMQISWFGTQGRWRRLLTEKDSISLERTRVTLSRTLLSWMRKESVEQILLQRFLKEAISSAMLCPYGVQMRNRCRQFVSAPPK